MDANVVMPVMIITALAIGWLFAETYGSRAVRIGTGLLAIGVTAGIAATIAHANGLIIGMHVSALHRIEDRLNAEELGDVRAALREYRTVLDDTGNPKRAAYLLNQKLYSSRVPTKNDASPNPD